MSFRKNQIIYIILLLIVIIGVLAFYVVTKIQGEKGYEGPISSEEDIMRMEKYIERNPEDIETMWELAERYSRVDRNYEKAHSLLSTILKIEPEHKLAMHLRGIILIEESKFSEALSQFEEILLIDENDPVTLHNISQLYFISDRQKALEYAKKAIAVAKQLAREDKEYTYSPMFEEWERAVTEFDAKFEEDPAAASLGMEEYFLAQPTLMLEICKLALESSEKSDPPNMQKLLERVGLLYTELGMDAEAVDTYEKLIEISPEYGRGYVLLANRLVKMDKLESLKDVHIKIQDHQKMVAEKNIIDILMQYHRGETDEAMERLQVINVDEYDILIYHTMGILYEQLGNKKGAIEYYNKALSYSNGDYEFWQAINYETTRAILLLDS